MQRSDLPDVGLVVPAAGALGLSALALAGGSFVYGVPLFLFALAMIFLGFRAKRTTRPAGSGVADSADRDAESLLLQAAVLIALVSAAGYLAGGLGLVGIGSMSRGGAIILVVGATGFLVASVASLVGWVGLRRQRQRTQPVESALQDGSPT